MHNDFSLTAQRRDSFTDIVTMSQEKIDCPGITPSAMRRGFTGQARSATNEKNALFHLPYGVCGLLCVVLLFFHSASADELSLGVGSEEPTRITSQKLIYNQASKEVQFLGDVHVTRSDFELWCKTMRVFLAKDQVSDQNAPNAGIEKIVAQDSVRLKMEARQAESDQAVYLADSQVITLEGNVFLQEGRNEIEAGRVVFYLEEERSEIFSSEGKRVNAIFYPSKDRQ